MNKTEIAFLHDTIDILVGYDGEHQVAGLKALIDEARERLIKLASGNVTETDLGSSEKYPSTKRKPNNKEGNVVNIYEKLRESI